MAAGLASEGIAGSGARSRLKGLWAIARAGEWWEHKLVPIITLFYATAFSLGSPLAASWPFLLMLLAALLPGAIWVSLLNDLTDRTDDREAGKPNRLEGRSPAFAALVIALPMAAGLAVGWMWRGTPQLLVPYALAWIAFALYSVPPIRLKTKAGLGVIADAAGSNLFPGLVAMLLAFEAAGSAVNVTWLVAGAFWSTAWGIRGILWHQLDDRAADEKAEVNTFVRRHGRASVVALGRFVVFPLELTALAALLWQLGSPLALLALLVYVVLARRRLRIFRMVAIVVDPRPRQLIVLLEYYAVFLPLAILLSSAIRHPQDMLVLLGHLLLFPAGAMLALRDGWRLRAA